MTRQIHFLHHSPGRIRIQVDGLKRNEKLAEAIHSLSDKVQGIRQITASTVTGSVLICYEKSDPHVVQRLESMADDAENLLDMLIDDPNALARRLNDYGIA